MRCINCSTDNTLQDRTDNLGRCKKCGHYFVFEPKMMLSKVTVTDVFFARLITKVSANETLFFTSSQLYYLLNMRLQAYVNKNDLATVFLFALFIIVSLIANIDKARIIGTIIIALIGVGGIFYFVGKPRKKRKVSDPLGIDRAQFDRWLARWNSINNPPEKLLPIPETNNLPAAPNVEVTAYSFDRVVICDTPEIAQLLISNNFHFENNCAILTIDGYPQHIFTTTMEMLRRNLDLKVYALHNCSPKGVQLASRLRQDENWFPNLTIPIIDVGILPRQIIDNLDILTLQSTASAELAQQLPPDVRNSLNPNELAWLDAGCYLELEFFSPQKLIRILQRAISESRELAVIEGDGMVVVDNFNFYTVDSFG
ncbi:hypothetical protein [Chamaesiphon polymorphus]|uniref:Uncharacterized protein n=1 Tax=Chamaesiphon polymorphus CCALA 037 TaxID=2107692 RepID=A0A2T1GMQ2_9CYAN|nr:hypothetical protein [Chamaesiphon polymorphus]PSB59184.1 hypothetical protein C7B77_01980 [Chamaesiphon polymorphus CCALA 037]